MNTPLDFTTLPMRILMISSEANPFAKVGGLADAVPALAAELARQGHDVRLVIPRYADTDRDGAEPIAGPLGIPMARSEYWTEVLEAPLPQEDEHTPPVRVYMIEHLELFGGDAIYARPEGRESGKDLLRFGVLSRSAFQLCRKLNWYPDVMHAHDWPAAPALVYLKTVENTRPFDETAGVFSIHNLGYQGVFPLEALRHLPLNPGEMERAGLEYFGRVNTVKAGILCAELVTTVSPSYAHDIQQPEHGFGLDGVLRQRANDLFGILNGIDVSLWSPEHDALIPARFDDEDLRGKSECKTALQKRYRLPVKADLPLIGMITRLVDQKGIAELADPGYGCLPHLLDEHELQLMILGTGEPRYEERLTELASYYPNMVYERMFDEQLAHLIEAASDFFLMPSRYEPCGLNQMYSLRYGTLPIATATGGLRDSIVDADDLSGSGTGFLFDRCTPSAIQHGVERAIATYHGDPAKLDAMRRRGMRQDFSWRNAAREYERVYLRALQLRMRQ